MSENKVSLKGVDDILQLFTAWLKTPEERMKIGLEGISGAVKEFAEANTIDIQNLERLVELHKSLGRSDDEIRELLDNKLEQVLESCNAIATLEKLKMKGIPLNVKVRKIEPPKGAEPEE